MSCVSLFTPKWKSRNQYKRGKVGSTSFQPEDGSNCCCACEPLPGYEEVERSIDYIPPSDDAVKVAQSVDDMADTISAEIQSLNDELRKLSLSMWNNPELGWEEHKTHDLFVNYFQGKEGWKVTPHAFGMETAFRMEFVHRPQGCSIKDKDLPTIGFQSELDALPEIGHACGHNLIAIAGVGASLGLAKALKKHDIPARIILLGTPAEEKNGGKIHLLAKGAYKEMDACLMVHPSAMNSVGKMLAKSDLHVKFKGAAAHSGSSPEQGINAEDAAVCSYVNISTLRQQIKPSHRIHGLILGDKSWTSNITPAVCNMFYHVRAPTAGECDVLAKRVTNCFKGAATATGCTLDLRIADPYKDVANNQNLAEMFCALSQERFKTKVTNETFFASTDFGDVTYALPALHAQFSIPRKNPKTDGNHTPGFADAARTPEAHKLTLQVASVIASIGAKIASDKKFRQETWDQWRRWKV